MQCRIKKYQYPNNKFPYVVQHRGLFRWIDNHRGHATAQEAKEDMSWQVLMDKAGPWGPQPSREPTITPSTWPLPWLWPLLALPRRIAARFYNKAGLLPKYNRTTGESAYPEWREKLSQWLERGRPRSPRRRLADWLRIDGCPRCGSKSFSGYGGDGWENSHVEVVDTWTESTMDGTDYRSAGWEFCARCGYRAWFEEGSL